jgi:magnesium transporter
MGASVARRSAKTGLPPGSLIHVGRHHARETQARVVVYDADSCDVCQADARDALPAPDQPGQVVWIDVVGLKDVKLLERIGQHFGIHPLVLEDIVNTEQRPKLEDYGQYLFLVVKTFDREEGRLGLDCDQVSLVLGHGFVLSFSEADGIGFETILERLRGGRGQIRRVGADYLLYCLLDAVVDSYFLLLETLGEEVERLETEVVERPRPRTIQEIHALRRQGISVRRVLWPLREVVNDLQRGESPLLKSGTLVYLRDVYDHTVHIVESLETLRELLAGVLDIYVSTVSFRISVVMKILTVITTIFMPLSLITGIYGMNFERLPGKDQPSGFFVVIGLMLAIAGSMLWLFRRKGWL